MTRNDYAHQIVDLVQGKHTTNNAWALVSWMQAEGGNALGNPLNTTLYEPGSWDYNSVGVKNYPSVAVGIQATAKTLLVTKNAGYDAILEALRRGTSAKRVLEAVEASQWGTGGLALKVLPYVKEDYWKYAGHAIAGS